MNTPTNDARPAIDPARLAEYERQAAEDLAGLCLPATGKFLEIGVSGIWLAEQLRQLGCGEAEIEAIGFAHGQRCFGADPWAAAVDQLAKYRAGRPDRLGPELADEIARDVFSKWEGGGS